MILTQEEIFKEINDGNIIIDPFDPKAVGPASIDLTLDNVIRVFLTDKITIQAGHDVDFQKVTTPVDLNKGYILKPRELVLGLTLEKITLPGNICGWLNSRSRFARIGLMSHVTAPFILPGISNQQVLEIYNAGVHDIKLIPNVKICHIILEICKGTAKYSGIFKNQSLK